MHKSYKIVDERFIINNSRSSSRFPAATECYTQLVVFKFYGSKLVYIVYTFDFNAMRCSRANLLARGPIEFELPLVIYM